MKVFSNAAAAAALAVAAIGSMAPPAPASAQQPGDAVAIPFAPPVGQKLTYRFTRVDREDGVEKRRRESRAEITFRRAGQDYLMDVRLVPDSVPAGAARDPAVGMLGVPLSFRVNGDGELTGIEDESRYWAALEQMLAKTDTAASAGAAVAALRELPPENRLAMLSANVAPLLSLSGSRFPLGETLEGEREGSSPIGPLPQRLQVTLERVADGRAYVTSITSTSAEAVEAATRAFVERVKGAPMDEGKLAAMEERDSFEVSMATGLVERQETTKTMEMEVGGKRSKLVRTETVERMP